MAYRRFDGTDDVIVLPRPAGLVHGSWTIAALVRCQGWGTKGIWWPHDGANVASGYGLTVGHGVVSLWKDGVIAAGTLERFYVNDLWQLLAVTIEDAPTIAPRFHCYDFLTETWKRSTPAYTFPRPATGSGIALSIGAPAVSERAFGGDIAGLAVWPSALSDATLSSLPATRLTAWRDVGAPAAVLVVLDQPNLASPVLNRVTGQAATSVVGTTVVNEMPPIAPADPAVKLKVAGEWRDRGVLLRDTDAWRAATAIEVLR